ncbi:type II toxin-antitoxin system RelE/ParE family toxin [Lactococcus nasutitermitis]|uniref:Type II toxin-antitoxin system RelE/ParE family toxin n=1 Tax=Lactococcus nasutitermitis TaxID=1652957 RepID=A0ABV9JB01_9LACT|nr:addiction module toxin RelE [Lactococcus nasutitermitis]
MTFEVKFTEFSQKDFIHLDGSQRKQILKSLTKIETLGLQVGQELHGKLSDCRKLKHKKLGLRVVFRQSPLGIEIIEIVVVGKRSDNEVYEIAEKRLGR